MGSTGLAESYVSDEFSTPDLTSLIELTAKNIDLTYPPFFVAGLIQTHFRGG